MADLPLGGKARAQTRAVYLHSLAQDSLLRSVLPSACHQEGPSTQAHLHTEMVPGVGVEPGALESWALPVLPV